MANVTQVAIEKDGAGWVLRVINPNLRPQIYRCSSKEQAQSLADLMTGARQGGPPGAAGSSK